ncbi:MAG: hypothetical protein IJT54_05900 [Candidatus Methanomethylophilaceae archaeon]|nr:hypothetical protein [Candidatus Methanomethylophilaceae archaeon]
MAKYFIPEQSELGQWLLELSACPGSLYGTTVTKTKLIEDLSYLISTARYVKKMVEDNEYLGQYRE